jgi:hypothetical protein
MSEWKNNGPDPALSDEEKDRLSEIFFHEVVPKLIRLHARNGMVSCEFAGTEYRSWQIRFRSMGSGFDIVDFEYDEDGTALDLDL